MELTQKRTVQEKPEKQDADYVFYELTRSICPTCRRVIDGHILLRDNKVYMRKRCPEHGRFEGLIYGDAEAYISSSRYNKPGTIPLQFSTEIEHGCPHDCGLCPDHQQHVCLGIIEVNSACNMDCPLCFADAGAGYNLTLGEVEGILDQLIASEGYPEVVQFSGGEPSIHPQITDMLQAAKSRHIRHVMLNTNGRRIAYDDDFLAELAEIQPAIYFQFDGFEEETYRVIRGEPDLLPEKLLALDRLGIDRQLILLAPSTFAEDTERQREIGNSAMASFVRLITAGVRIGDVQTAFSPEILAAMVVGTLNMVTISWAMNSDYPIFAKLEEARVMFEFLICKDNP